MLPYGTPHDTVPFDRIRMEHYEEAIIEGMRREKEEFERICNNPAAPTFDNTVSVDWGDGQNYYYGLLGRVMTVMGNLLSAETNDEMEALSVKMQPLLTQHSNDMTLDPRMFARIKQVYDRYADGKAEREYTIEEEKVLKDSYDGMVRMGALLDDEGKRKLRGMLEEADMLGLRFSQNLLKEQKAFSLHLTDEADLDGLPERVVAAAAVAAREREGAEKDDGVGNDGYGWLFTLDFPSYSPFMTYSTRRALRQKMYMANATVCMQDNEENNTEICRRIVNLRTEIVQLLGYETYADFVLVKRMASSVENVRHLFGQLIKAYKPTALRETEDIRATARRTEGEDFEMEPWDVMFYGHKLQMERYNLDSEVLRPYFKLDNVISGVFSLATRLYGITFKENKDIPVYHPDVKAYEVYDEDGTYLAVLYADFYPRKGKHSGAWMTEYKSQYIKSDGENVRPHVSLVTNFTKPTAGKPALLSLGEVETFLHEFGHTLHGMFANTHYACLSGTSVCRDFVELPSQFMENYAVEPDFLRTFAFHYETGEAMPDELIKRIRDSRNFNVARACLRQVGYGLLDMAYHTLRDKLEGDIVKFEKEAWKDAMVDRQRTDTCMTVQFSHIMDGGYSAGYYSYKWAEVLDADAFAVFRKEGIFNRETARRFRDCILSRGGTEHPMTLYKRFKGSEPTIDALMERNGIRP
ncbi:MAG: M3 family metallopeptidase [Prevotella sp.]